MTIFLTTTLGGSMPRGMAAPATPTSHRTCRHLSVGMARRGTRSLAPMVAWCSTGGIRTMELGLLFLVATRPRTLFREPGRTTTTSTAWATSSVRTPRQERGAPRGGTMLPRSWETATAPPARWLAPTTGLRGAAPAAHAGAATRSMFLRGSRASPARGRLWPRRSSRRPPVLPRWAGLAGGAPWPPPAIPTSRTSTASGST
mmetsp:Transcript_70846/g.191499  ORF Transcript_70846/g.191499 Transcript_70846/m.191499 type:complete len:202 (+) Transcript_70846:341-946(+)